VRSVSSLTLVSIPSFLLVQACEQQQPSPTALETETTVAALNISDGIRFTSQASQPRRGGCPWGTEFEAIELDMDDFTPPVVYHEEPEDDHHDPIPGKAWYIDGVRETILDAWVGLDWGTYNPPRPHEEYLRDMLDQLQDKCWRLRNGTATSQDHEYFEKYYEYFQTDPKYVEFAFQARQRCAMLGGQAFGQGLSICATISQRTKDYLLNRFQRNVDYSLVTFDFKCGRCRTCEELGKVAMEGGCQ
jgi:hypothetical protein